MHPASSGWTGRAQLSPRRHFAGRAWSDVGLRLNERLANSQTQPWLFAGTRLLLHRCQSGRLKDEVMIHLLLLLVFGSLFMVLDQASADQLKSTEISSRQRCVCTSYREARIVHYRRLRVIRSAYLIGYDVLPYRFGSTYVWQRPYRYYRHVW